MLDAKFHKQLSVSQSVKNVVRPALKPTVDEKPNGSEASVKKSAIAVSQLCLSMSTLVFVCRLYTVYPSKCDFITPTGVLKVEADVTT